MVFVRIPVRMHLAIGGEVITGTHPPRLFVRHALRPSVATRETSVHRFQRRADEFDPLRRAPGREIDVEAAGYHDEGVDPCAVDDELFARGYSVRHDSLASDGSGEWIPLRFGSWRRESQDDLALLSPARRDSFVQHDRTAPVFNLTPFRRPTPDNARRYSRSAQVPDVPEAVTSASETEDNDATNLDGWCRRRSTFSDQIHPSPARTAPTLAF